MATKRYYVIAENAEHRVELFKLEHAPHRTVIAPSLAARVVDVPGIHITHHAPDDGLATRIIHASDGHGTDIRIPLDVDADVAELGRVVVDVSDMDWRAAKAFRKTAYDEVVTVDPTRDGPYINSLFFIGTPTRLVEQLDALIESGQLTMWVPRPDGFATVPGGHQIAYQRVIFDDEPEVTVGSLLLACQSPKFADASEPYTGPPLWWVAYGSGGQVATGETQAPSDA